MEEKSLRRMHRTVGIILALFILIQAVSGSIFSIEALFGKYWEIIHVIHYRFSQIGSIYRFILGMGIVWMSLSGIMIYMKIRARTKPKQSESPLKK